MVVTRAAHACLKSGLICYPCRLGIVRAGQPLKEAAEKVIFFEIGVERGLKRVCEYQQQRTIEEDRSNIRTRPQPVQGCQHQKGDTGAADPPASTLEPFEPLLIASRKLVLIVNGRHVCRQPVANRPPIDPCKILRLQENHGERNTSCLILETPQYTAGTVEPG
jgi:hypothetical protein